MKLASGIATVVRGCEPPACIVGLGTDGAASNNDLDMFEAMRQAALLAKLRRSIRGRFRRGIALEMATIDGAPCARDGASRLASLETGKRADLITVSMDGRAADADVRSAVAPRLRDPRRRREDDDRERAAC